MVLGRAAAQAGSPWAMFTANAPAQLTCITTLEWNSGSERRCRTGGYEPFAGNANKSCRARDPDFDAAKPDHSIGLIWTGESRDDN